MSCSPKGRPVVRGLGGRHSRGRGRPGGKEAWGSRGSGPRVVVTSHSAAEGKGHRSS